MSGLKPIGLKLDGIPVDGCEYRITNIEPQKAGWTFKIRHSLFDIRDFVTSTDRTPAEVNTYGLKPRPTCSSTIGSASVTAAATCVYCSKAGGLPLHMIKRGSGEWGTVSLSSCILRRSAADRGKAEVSLSDILSRVVTFSCADQSFRMVDNLHAQLSPFSVVRAICRVIAQLILDAQIIGDLGIYSG